MKKLACLLLFTTSLTSMPGLAGLVQDFSFEGELGAQSDLAWFEFSLDSAGVVEMRTWSYAGGVNAVGADIDAGGFDPAIYLFSSSGSYLIHNDDGFGASVDPISGTARDSIMMLSLSAGSYRLALSLFSNVFSFSCGEFLGSTSGFDGRTSSWALDILGASSASGPVKASEPNGIFMFLLAIMAFYSYKCRVKSNRGFL